MNEIVELASRLVATDSVNPGLVSGGAGEREAANVVAEWCRGHGFEVEIVGDERPSVIAVRRGRGGGRSLLLNGHLDTVGVAGMDAPFEPRVDNGRLHGRGSYDMKGALAAVLVAAANAGDHRGDVIVTAVADEELASVGTETVLEHVTADAAIVAEPTELQVAVAHRGFVGFEIETSGIAAHGSRPDLGEDAIVKMGPILTALDELDVRLQAGTPHPLPGETVGDVQRELAEIARGAKVRIVASRDPYEAATEDPFVELVQHTAGVNGLVGAPFWTDAALVAAAGIPTVLLGPIGGGAHAEVEWVDLASLERLHDIVVRVVRAWCG